MSKRAVALLLTTMACFGCGGKDGSPASSSVVAPVRDGDASAFGKRKPTEPGEFYLLTINCEPKGDKRAHFLVMPASGGAAPIQLRCKGVADVKGPGPFVVRPADDTADKGYSCDPSPIKVKLEKPLNRVTCTRP